MSNTKAEKIQFTNYAFPIFAIHLIALFAFVPSFITWPNVLLMAVGVLVFGQGINLGYHRLLTHRSLRVPKWLEYFFVLLALCCMEETPGKWVSTHRKHHTDSDDPEEDPHSPNYGIFWSHMGWLLFRRRGKNSLNIDHRYAGDILNDPVYMYLEKHWWVPNILVFIQYGVCFAIAYGIFALGLGQQPETAIWNATGAAMWGVMLRIVVVWHITWSVNSLSHVLGYQNYDTGERSRNNWFVALIASGEGWHNNHHADPASASVQHKWWELDATYYVILVLEKLGLAKRVVRPRHIRQKQRLQEKQRNEAELSEATLKANPSAVAEEQLPSDSPQAGDSAQTSEKAEAVEETASVD